MLLVLILYKNTLSTFSKSINRILIIKKRGSNIVISLIIPVYNEEINIRKTIQEVKNTLGNLNKEYEIIIVNDGSTDNTLQILSQINDIIIVSYAKNVGKGYALKQGIKKAQGSIIGFIDGDGEIDSKYLHAFIRQVEQKNADIVIGRKANLKQSIRRKIYSIGFNTLILFLFGLKMETQVGIKVFNRKVTLLNITNNKYIFDLELMYKCKKAKLNIKEVPINVRSVNKENRIFLVNALVMFKDILKLRLG